MEFDPLGEECLRDPYVVYERLRRESPIIWHRPLDSWLVTRYRDCVAILRDHRRFASDIRRMGAPLAAQALSIQSLDPPEHTSIRHAVMNAYRAVCMESVEASAREDARSLVGELAASRGGELMCGLAMPLALRTICTFLGVPVPELTSLQRISDAIVASMDGGLRPEYIQPGVAARAELSSIVASWLDRARDDGFLGALARDSMLLPRDLLLNTVRVVFHAGYTSVYSAVGNAILALLRNQVDLERLADPGLDAAIEELFRYDGPVQATRRICVDGAEIGGQYVRPGQSLTLLLGAANRDPDEFERPEELIFDRRKNHHLGFGWGVHVCIGGHLGKAVTRAAVAAVRDGLPAMRLDGVPRHRKQATLRCPARLPVAAGERTCRMVP